MIKSIASDLTADGIQEKHIDEVFLLQRKNCPPNLDCTIDRIYNDGSFYFYINNSKSWALVTTLNKGGLNELKTLLADHCRIIESPTEGLSSKGTLEFIFNVNECSRKIVIYGVDYGRYAELQKVSSLINSNLDPIKME
jgi:hypothetical protein